MLSLHARFFMTEGRKERCFEIGPSKSIPLNSGTFSAMVYRAKAGFSPSDAINLIL